MDPAFRFSYFSHYIWLLILMSKQSVGEWEYTPGVTEKFSQLHCQILNSATKSLIIYEQNPTSTVHHCFWKGVNEQVLDQCHDQRFLAQSVTQNTNFGFFLFFFFSLFLILALFSLEGSASHLNSSWQNLWTQGNIQGCSLSSLPGLVAGKEQTPRRNLTN